ncbi:MAG TPA: hypothetical protein DCZ88_15175 [Pseudanabaena sp.]|nr:hypothetical protein [Pseudanabaena sp.]
MDNSYIYVITALLPLAASMLVFQTNPYHALVIRGVLGAIAALVYTVLGAPDVALTEALVGTLLAITLYAVAVRSSLVLRLGVLQTEMSEDQNTTDPEPTFLQQFVNNLNKVFKVYHLRVELVPYCDREELYRALMVKEIHATCEREVKFTSEEANTSHTPDSDKPPCYHTTTRLLRLYDIMNNELLSPMTKLSYLDPAAIAEVQS